MTHNSDTHAKKNALEWTVFSLSLLLVIGIITSLIWQALSTGDQPARLIVTMGKPLISREQVRIPLKVANLGDEAANTVDVEVSGELDSEKITSSLSLEYVPHRAERNGWVSFPGNHLPSGLSARVVGYEQP